jgi:uncharacterized protein DUF4132
MPLGRLLGRTPQVSEHEERAGRFVDAIEEEYEQHGPKRNAGGFFTYDSTTQIDPWAGIDELESGRDLLAQPSETLVSAALVAAGRARTKTAFPWSPHALILAALARKRLPFTKEHAAALLRRAGDVEGEARGVLLSAALHATELVGPEGLTRDLRRALDKLDRVGDPLVLSDARRLRARLLALLPDEDAFKLPANDDWSKRMRPQLARLKGSGPVLRHLGLATQSKPTKKWEREAEEVLQGREELVRAVLETAAEADETVVTTWRHLGTDWNVTHYLAPPNAVLVKGAAWAAGVLDAEWAAPALGRIARKAFENNDAVANACLLVLGQLSDERAVRELATLQATIKHRGVQKRIVAALEAAGERAGLSASQLLERLVPDFGLDHDGRKEVAVGGWRAVIAAETTGVRLTWRNGDKEQRTVPVEVKELHATELKRVKADVAELRKGISLERTRIESLFAEEPRWSSADWRTHYLEHPLVSVFARTLIWSFDGVAALGRDAPKDAEEVELWHPIRAEPAEVAQWRGRLVAAEIRQPVKQAYRELYLVAPAEEQTRVYSNRFAGHVLRYAQAYALFKGRGWGGNALGPWDGGYEATIRREFRSHGLRAEFYLQMVETDDVGALADLATTDQVRFYPLTGRHPEPVPLVDVSPRVFSEAMRDVDLFVGVSSITSDPTWLDRGVERFNQYWYEASFGELTGLAETRRSALRELVPKLKIADRCELDDRFLVVRGGLGTYKIHLGSGNVLMEPQGQYLCIVPAPGKTERLRGKVFSSSHSTTTRA